MKNPFVKKLVALFFIFYLPFHSMAWGLLGHRIVGEIADSYLTPQTKKEIKLLLGTESIGMVSNWMDFIKSDSTYKYLGNWHYINMESGFSQNEFQAFLDKDTSTNAYTKILFISKELKKKILSHSTRSMYLKTLIHLVGDIHQPLHVGRPDDHGGNKIKVMWFNENINLHQLWDDRLINFQQLSYTEYARAINHTSKLQRNTWEKETLGQWLWQSYQYAENIYSDINTDDKVGYSYNFKYIAIINQQLLKGGVHLAGLLNDIFD